MKKPVVAVLALALAAGGAVAWNVPTTRPMLERAAAALGYEPENGHSYSGYVDADYVYVASTIGGTLRQLAVARGDRVEAGQLLYRLDDDAGRAARDQAKAMLDQADATLANLLTGKRAPEIAAIVAQRAQAAAALRASEAEYERQRKLRLTGTSALKQLQDALAQRDRDRAQLAQMDAQISVAKLPGRDEEIRAAEAAVGAARAGLAQAEWKLGQKTGMAPAGAMVVDTLYRPGESVPANAPVVQLLPPENLKLRFFAPEAEVARLSVGETISATCDGCGKPIAATIRYIAPRAEYTPPVIYSREQRARLVFMIEARPDEGLDRLRVGQPVDVTVATATAGS
jgi:HlyD family secretion protein